VLFIIIFGRLSFPVNNQLHACGLCMLPCRSFPAVILCMYDFNWCCQLVVANCSPSPMTCGSCLCREHITNSVIGVSRPLVLDCGTTFHLDYGGWDWPSTPSDNLWRLNYLATEALSDSFEFIGAIVNKLIYLSIYNNWTKVWLNISVCRASLT